MDTISQHFREMDENICKIDRAISAMMGREGLEVLRAETERPNLMKFAYGEYEKGKEND